MKMQLSDFLCSELSVTKVQLSKFLPSAPNRYKVYSIPKRTSGKRIIAHPAKQLKKYQRALAKKLTNELPIHHVATAYKKGMGIKVNAEIHKNSRFLLKMDFDNFFHSITPALFFEEAIKSGLKFSSNDIVTLTQILFWRPGKKSNGKLILSIGAPSSPVISNFIMYHFDEGIYQECKKRGVKYSRYADDISFSTNVKGALFEVPSLVQKFLTQQYKNKITINDGKTVFSSMAHNRHITGVTITNEGKLSIGRSRKRYISSLIHRYTLGELSVEDFYHLRGLIAYTNDIEPSFIPRMSKKYSTEIMSKIAKGEK
jgi:RNA-directed DNA polymerase